MSSTERPRDARAARDGDAAPRSEPAARGGSAGGFLLAAILFSASLTPSLMPRSPEVQGVLGGMVAAIGFAAWWAGFRAWVWLGLPVATGRRQQVLRRLGGLAALAMLMVVSWHAADWQNTIRRLWGLDPVATMTPAIVLLVAVPVFLALLFLGRLFLWLLARGAKAFTRYLPPRLAFAVAALVAASLIWAVFSGVLVKGALRAIDVSALATDALIAPDLPLPTRAGQTGSAQSLIAWRDLGRWGRSFVASAPTGARISAFWGQPAMDPLRVYVGLTAAGSPEARAQLAFEELRRAGGFDRAVLVIAVPTGSGWLDPGAQDTLDYMHRGNVATVAVQYSYLSSWISLLVDPGYGLAEAQALFDLVYSHWTTLPRDARPRLYLHGLSLGAYLSQSTVPLLDVLADPFDGAMWAGSPFLSEFWRFVVDRRAPDSPAWRPRFGNGSLIRATNQDGRFDDGVAPWGPMRLVLLQYASDPIVFFDRSLAWRRPDWLTGERGPDVSPQMRWFPVVTFLQVGLDMGVSLGIPGYGHDYIARHYIPAWAETTEPEGWTPEREATLQALFAERVR